MFPEARSGPSGERRAWHKPKRSGRSNFVKKTWGKGVHHKVEGCYVCDLKGEDLSEVRVAAFPIQWSRQEIAGREGRRVVAFAKV